MTNSHLKKNIKYINVKNDNCIIEKKSNYHYSKYHIVSQPNFN
jgi:hypothetical protein